MEGTQTLILVALIGGAFLISGLLHRYAERSNLVSGIEYALVGVLIGPVMPWNWQLITPELLRSFDLLISLLLGLLGFMVGLHAREAMRRFEHFMAGSVAALGVVVVVGVAMLEVVQRLIPFYLDDPTPMIAIPVWTDGRNLYEVWAADDALWLALTLGAAAAVASVSAIETTAERWQAEGRPVLLLKDLASAGMVLAIMIFGIGLAGDRAVESADNLGLSLVEWSLLIGAAGAATGALFTVFIGGAEDDLRVYLATVGAVIFAAGIGAALGISPLFVNLIAGLTVASTSAQADHLRTNLDPMRRPVSILLMVFAGVAWAPLSGWLWLIPVVYLLLRVGARLVASRLAVATFVHGTEFRRVGGGLIGQGSLAAAIALSWWQGHPNTGPLVLSAVLVPMLITDLFAVRILRRVLANAGAIRPRAKLAPEDQPAPKPEGLLVNAPEASGIRATIHAAPEHDAATTTGASAPAQPLPEVVSSDVKYSEASAATTADADTSGDSGDHA